MFKKTRRKISIYIESMDTCLAKDMLVTLRSGWRILKAWPSRIPGFLSQLLVRREYESVTVGDEVYLYRADNPGLGTVMRQSREVRSRDEMDLCLELMAEAGRLGQGKIIFDIGANIGTTSIHFKKTDPGVNLIAFEPIRGTYRLLCCNAILNDCSDIVTENLACSDVSSTALMFSEYAGSDTSTLMTDRGNEEVRTIRLDDYIAGGHIDPDSVAFIWMDVEGHEAHAVSGMKELLGHGVPLYMEFNPEIYKKAGVFEGFIRDVSEIYDEFRCVQACLAGDDTRRPVSELANYAEHIGKYMVMGYWGSLQCDLLFTRSRAT